MKKTKLKKEKAYSQCAVIGSLPDLKCSDVQIPNRITKVKMDLEGNCYDELDNYLGKGILEDGMLKITQEVRANYL